MMERNVDDRVFCLGGRKMTSLAQWAYTFGIGLTIIAPSFQLWRISLIWVLGFSVLFLTAMCAPA